MIRFLKHLLAYFKLTTPMADINDLNNALNALKAQSAGLVGQANQVLSDAQSALARAGQLPPPADYQPQIDIVNAVAADITAAEGTLTQAQGTIAQILP